MGTPLLSHLDQKIIIAYQQFERCKSAKELWDALSLSLSEEQANLFALRQGARKELADVQELEGVNLTSIMQTITGSRKEQLAKESEEFELAKRKFAEVAAKVKHLKEEMVQYEADAGQYGAIEQKYEILLTEKEQLVVEGGGESGRILSSLTSDLTGNLATLDHIVDGLHFGPLVVKGLQRLQDTLSSSNRLPYTGSRERKLPEETALDNVRKRSYDVRQNLRHFQAEIQHIELSLNMTQDIGAFKTVGEYFNHGLQTDFVVANQVSATSMQILEIQHKLEKVIEMLLGEQSKLEEMIDQQRQKRQELLFDYC